MWTNPCIRPPPRNPHTVWHKRQVAPHSPVFTLPLGGSSGRKLILSWRFGCFSNSSVSAGDGNHTQLNRTSPSHPLLEGQSRLHLVVLFCGCGREPKGVMLPGNPSNLGACAQAPGSSGGSNCRSNCQCVFQRTCGGSCHCSCNCLPAVTVDPLVDRKLHSPALKLGTSQLGARQFPSQAGPPRPRRACFGLQNKGGSGSELRIWTGRQLNAIPFCSVVLPCRVLSRTHTSLLPPSWVRPARLEIQDTAGGSSGRKWCKWELSF